MGHRYECGSLPALVPAGGFEMPPIPFLPGDWLQDAAGTQYVIVSKRSKALLVFLCGGTKRTHKDWAGRDYKHSPAPENVYLPSARPEKHAFLENLRAGELPFSAGEPSFSRVALGKTAVF